VHESKRVVYVLKSAQQPPHYYVGVTSSPFDRLADHNAGRCPHTSRHRPWSLHVTIEFASEHTALRFERYLKSGSGREFPRRHFECVALPSPQGTVGDTPPDEVARPHVHS